MIAFLNVFAPGSPCNYHLPACASACMNTNQSMLIRCKHAVLVNTHTQQEGLFTQTQSHAGYVKVRRLPIKLYGVIMSLLDDVD